LEKTVIPEKIFDNLEKTFGERIQPSEAVRRILEDIRIHGHMLYDPGQNASTTLIFPQQESQILKLKLL
jgi:hypothetical protein